jgi:hypothetical protein
MYLIAAFFDRKALTQRYRIRGKYLEHFKSSFPDYEQSLKAVKSCLGYFTGNREAPALSLELESYEIKGSEISFVFRALKVTDMKSGCVMEEIRELSGKRGWLGKDGLPPIVCLAAQKECEDMCECARLAGGMDAFMKNKDYKGALDLLAPLKEVKDNGLYWNNAGILYRLGLACSKMAVTLKIKASEKAKLDAARQYREFCEEFLQRGAEIERGARCASALAYRYYSNVHELTRQGERRDQDLEEQIEKANEWLSRAIEVYPESVRNNYRKGKLIIVKQAPYLLFAKKSYGEEEARLLREIREVGEEHLASAIAIYESLEDERVKEKSRREYAKALFVLGGYYLDNAYLPVHEYFLGRIAGKQDKVVIKKISKMDIESAKENLEKCFAAETDMSLTKLDTGRLANEVKKWTRTPVEKLYRLGCVYNSLTFIALAEGEADKARANAKAALYYLNAAKSVADKCDDRRRNTWHISEKIAWTYIYMGQYKRAAELIARAKAGYVVNTRAIALLLTRSKENKDIAREALQTAAGDRRNLAPGLSRVLLAYILGGPSNIKNLSSKNLKLAGILGVSTGK